MEVKDVQPLPAMDNWAGAIQHAVIVTRPDPSRAEMAMHLYPYVIAEFNSAVAKGQVRTDPNWREGCAGEAVRQADALLGALKEKP
jgi:hypothetical protein